MDLLMRVNNRDIEREEQADGRKFRRDGKSDCLVIAFAWTFWHGHRDTAE